MVWAILRGSRPLLHIFFFAIVSISVLITCFEFLGPGCVSTFDVERPESVRVHRHVRLGDVAEAVLGGFQDPEGLDPALLRWEDVPPVLVGEDVCRGKNH